MGGIYKVPWYPWLPAIYLVGVIALLVFRAVFEWEKSLIDLAFLLTGLPVSFIWLRKRRLSSNGGGHDVADV